MKTWFLYDDWKQFGSKLSCSVLSNYPAKSWEELKKTARNLTRYKPVMIQSMEQKRWNIPAAINATVSPRDLKKAKIHYIVCKMSLIKCASEYSPAGKKESRAEPSVSYFNIAAYLGPKSSLT
jgi:hypothetical protein